MIGGMDRNAQSRFSRDRHTHGPAVTAADAIQDDLPPTQAIADAIYLVAASSAAMIRRRGQGSSRLPLLQCPVPDSNMVVQAWHSDDGLPDQFSASGRHMFPAGPRLIIARQVESDSNQDLHRTTPNPPRHLLPLSLAQQHFQDDEDILSLDSAGPLSQIGIESTSKVINRAHHPLSTFTDPSAYPSTIALSDSHAAALKSDLIDGFMTRLPLSVPLADMQVVAQYVLGPGVYATVRWRALAAPAAVQAFVAANSARTWRGIQLGQGLLASHPEVVVHVHQVERMGSPQIRKVEREIKESIRFWRIVEGEETWGESQGDAEGGQDEQGEDNAENNANDDVEHPRPPMSRPAKRAKVMGVADLVDDFLDHFAALGNDPSALFGDNDAIDDDDDNLSVDGDVSRSNQPSLISDADLTTSPTMSRRILPTRTDHDFTERLWIYLRAARDPDDLSDAMDVIVGAIEAGTLVPQVALPNPTYFASTLRKFLAYTALESTSVVKAKALDEVKNELDIFVGEPLPQLLEVSLWKLARDCVIALAGEWAQLDHVGMILVLRAWVKALAVLVHVDTYAPGLPRAVLDTVAEKLVNLEGSGVGDDGLGQEEEDVDADSESAAGDDGQDETGERELGTPGASRDESHLGSFPLSAFSPDTAQFVSRLPPAARWTVTFASRTVSNDAPPAPADGSGGESNIVQGGGGSPMIDAVWTIDIRRRDDLAGMLDGDELERFEVTVGMAECFLV
ncbi:hypothetical protein BCR44DRAFT_1427729 [Catenaria anguillulae PL171]|uniref:Uncharacterized protein n=1 Tax=Catenaria anguillulae PL171 TaxID=765915 RepID=A0A1Y2HVU7_9FUNG|nr:hypothetical protein BCR44DRAFT_1427729 [Catenaria anguillulae PL171]